MDTVYIVVIQSKKEDTVNFSPFAYLSLEDARSFVQSRSDYYGQPYDDADYGLDVETNANFYSIVRLTIDKRKEQS